MRSNYECYSTQFYQLKKMSSIIFFHIPFQESNVVSVTSVHSQGRWRWNDLFISFVPESYFHVLWYSEQHLSFIMANLSRVSFKRLLIIIPSDSAVFLKVNPVLVSCRNKNSIYSQEQHFWASAPRTALESPWIIHLQMVTAFLFGKKQLRYCHTVQQ